MTVISKIQFEKDLANKKITVVREFNAPLKDVWNAWTQSEMLENWWAPKPWKAKTKSMDFRPGGMWLYYMLGPDGSKMWNRVDFLAINHQKNFSTEAIFCDENGNKNDDFPTMKWKNEFSATETGSKVLVTITFDKEADFKKIIEMGFEEGFTAGLGNLDELLEQ